MLVNVGAGYVYPVVSSIILVLVNVGAAYVYPVVSSILVIVNVGAAFSALLLYWYHSVWYAYGIV